MMVAARAAGLQVFRAAALGSASTVPGPARAAQFLQEPVRAQTDSELGGQDLWMPEESARSVTLRLPAPAVPRAADCRRRRRELPARVQAVRA